MKYLIKISVDCYVIASDNKSAEKQAESIINELEEHPLIQSAELVDVIKSTGQIE